MNLVRQRLEWEAKYALGGKPQFKAYEDYKKNRLSEGFRLNSGLEEFMEYVISLEMRLTK